MVLNICTKPLSSAEASFNSGKAQARGQSQGARGTTGRGKENKPLTVMRSTCMAPNCAMDWLTVLGEDYITTMEVSAALLERNS